ncbi:MAG: prepilin-type N-terminal cleavage/methylation domain-containing protein [Akkermansia sp.]
MKTIHNLSKRGFTLIELMAAMAITSILILVIVALTSKGVDMWRMVIQDVRTSAMDRVAMDTMTKDFESMQIRSGNGFEWLNVQRDPDFENNSLVMGPKGAKFANASRLIFFTVATDRNPAIRSDEAKSYREDMNANKKTSGDVSCVAYKLAYRDQILNQEAGEDNVGFPVYSLYRNLVPPHRTFEDLLGKTDLYQAYKRFESDETRPLNFLVENIVEMTLVFEVEYQDKITKDGENPLAWRELRPVPIIATGMARRGTYRELRIYGNHIDAMMQGSRNSDMMYGSVVGLNIALTVVTDEGMIIVDQVRKGERPMPKAETFFSKYTRSFSQRVEIPKAD